nr:hypothetical protein [Herbiconiux sp.]
MTVAVVGADRHDADTGGELAVEGVALVGAAVVGDLHDVDGTEGSGRRHRALRLLPQVAEEEHPERTREEHDDARIVSDERHSPGRGGRGPEDVEAVGTEAAREPAGGRDDLGAARAELREQAFVGPAVGGAHECAVDTAENRLEPADVVEVVVGEHEEVETIDAQAVETGRERLGIGAHIDEGGEARVPHEHGVALADVARGELPVGRNGTRTADHASGEGTRDHRPAQEHRGRRPEGHTRIPASSMERDREEDEHQHGSERSGEAVRELDGRERQCGEEAGDGSDPGRGQPREPRGDLSEARRDHGQHADDQPEHAHGGGSGLGEEVCGHGVRGELGREEEQDRLAGELGGHRNGDRDGECGRDALRDQAREGAGEQEQTGRGEHREREARAPAEPGVEGEEHDDGEAERWDAGGGPAEGQRDEHDRSHRGGTEHARFGRDEHHEQQEHPDRDRDAHSTPEADGTSDEHHGRDDDGAVRSGDGGEVGEARDGHGVAELVGHVRVVADREPREQVGAVARESGGGVAEGVAHAAGPGNGAGRVGEMRQVCVREEQELSGFPRRKRRERAPGAHPGADLKPSGCLRLDGREDEGG